MSSADTSPLEPGTRFGQYEIIRIVGRGAMGSVFEARHIALKKRVALKIMHPTVASSDDMVTRFMREGEAAARIQHPHVVDVSDVGVHDGRPYLVMEYLEGEDLGHMIDREGPLAVDRVVAIILPVVSALAAAHEAGVVHRDLKPENIFLAKGRGGDLHPTVLDFGISKLTDTSPGANDITKTTAILGTPYYMSPESTIGAKAIDARSDQYSLGVILYECITAKKPYAGDSLYDLLTAINAGGAKPPSFIRTGVPTAFDNVILRAMHKDPAQRHSSLGALARAMLDFGSEKTRAYWLDEFARSASSASALARQPASAAALAPVPPRASTAKKPAAASVAEVDALSSSSDVPVATRAAPTNRLWFAVVPLAIALALFVGLTMRSPAAPPTADPSAPAVHAGTLERQTFHVDLAVTPSTAEIELDGQHAAVGNIARDLPRDGVGHHLRISAPGHASQTVTFRDAPPPPWIELTRLQGSVAESPAPPAPVALAPAPRVSAQPSAPRPASNAGRPAAAQRPATNSAPAAATAHGTATSSHPSGTNGAPILN